MAEKKTRALFEEAGTETADTPVAPGLANAEKTANRGRVRLWQFILAALVVLIVIVGGMTRLTDSGLSITEWNLVTGVLPPLSHEGWLSEFAKYQKIPEFELNKPTSQNHPSRMDQAPVDPRYTDRSARHHRLVDGVIWSSRIGSC